MTQCARRLGDGDVRHRSQHADRAADHQRDAAHEDDPHTHQFAAHEDDLIDYPVAAHEVGPHHQRDAAHEGGPHHHPDAAHEVGPQNHPDAAHEDDLTGYRVSAHAGDPRRNETTAHLTAQNAPRIDSLNAVDQPTATTLATHVSCGRCRTGCSQRSRRQNRKTPRDGLRMSRTGWTTRPRVHGLRCQHLKAGWDGRHLRNCDPHQRYCHHDYCDRS